ncbi:hypothetical protein GL325_06705 [Aeromicrobium sp. 636]|uniref:Uncharacterized protein n=1 Tax=Aeromicrobium senzhongii TaxID=2663859 RepID=A0A8I0EVA6_9ACTN|nr:MULTISPECIES: hypothetical protein [Aeromicrobium]MBC9226002.1 hypothetical protein [Aeromicrobium senzhongii]MCQ3998109.1 hypothetical protein [Aeromicrobium sp. 636]
MGYLGALMLAFPLLSACGEGDAVDPEATASAPPSLDADGYTTEQREALDLVDAFLVAAYDRGTQPIAETSRDLVTDEFGADLIKTNKAQVEDAGLKWLGPYTFEPSEVEIEGDEAAVSGCLDLTAMFLVPRSAKAAGPGSTNVGEVLPATYRLEKSGGRWLLSGYDDAETPC